MSDRTRYDADFYTWTQRQADRLRTMQVDAGIDADLLAEEVADLGRSQLNKVREHLTQILVHLLKAAASPADQPRGHWISEAETHQEQARDACSPGMRPHLDVGTLWRRALSRTGRALDRHGEPALPADLSCPFALDELLDPNFDPVRARDRLAGTLQSGRNG